MASQALATISEPRSKPCAERKSLLSRWLGVFALNAGQPLAPDALSVYVALWTEGFADLSDDVLEAALKKTLATCKFWPVRIADVREHVERAEDSRAEDEWQNLLEYCRVFVNADLGMASKPKLPPEIDHAARAAGGIYYLESCSVNDLQWAKKRFVEDLTRQRKTGEIAGLLLGSELRELLKVAAPRFALPPAAAAYFGHPGTRSALAQREEALTAEAVLRGTASASPSPTYTRCPEHTPGMSALLRQGERASRRQAELGLRGDVPKTPSPAHPQVADLTDPELAENSAPKTLVFGTGELES